jgi:hypothetical protein
MVVDSERSGGSDQCEDSAGPCDVAPGYPCGYFRRRVTDHGRRDRLQRGPLHENVPCDLGEHRYITKDTPDIAGPSSASPASAPREQRWATPWSRPWAPSSTPPSPSPGGCNAGFLRPDALLVLTMIGPEDDPGGWVEGEMAGVAAGGRGRQARRSQRHRRARHHQRRRLPPDTDPDIRLCNLIPSFPYSVLEHLTLEDYGPPSTRPRCSPWTPAACSCPASRGAA